MSPHMPKGIVPIPITTNKADLRKVITEGRIEAMLRVIRKWWPGSDEIDPDEYFGLAYTSSGEFAALWAANVHYHVGPGEVLQCFTLTNDGHVRMMCDKDPGTEIWYEIGSIYEKVMPITGRKMGKTYVNNMTATGPTLRGRIEKLSELALRMEDMCSDIREVDPDGVTDEIKVEIEALVAKIQELL